MKWQATQKQLGITDEGLSVSVKKLISDYNDFEQTLDEKRAALAGATDAEKRKIENQIQTLEKGLLNVDMEITKKLKYLDKHKDRLAGMTHRLKTKQAEKKAAKGTTVSTPAVTEPPPAAEAKLPADGTTVTKDPKTPASPPPPVKNVPAAAKKSATDKNNNNVWWWIGGIAATIATGGVAYYFWFRKSK